jgi:hypothetical protein
VVSYTADLPPASRPAGRQVPSSATAVPLNGASVPGTGRGELSALVWLPPGMTDVDVVVDDLVADFGEVEEPFVDFGTGPACVHAPHNPTASITLVAIVNLRATDPL